MKLPKCRIVVIAIFIGMFIEDVARAETAIVTTHFKNILSLDSQESLSKALSVGVERSEKKKYTYILWDIAASKGVIHTLSDNEALVSIASLACGKPVVGEYVKVDIVRIKEQDSYGKPRWDTAEQIAHGRVDAEVCVKLLNAPATADTLKEYIKDFKR